MHTELNDAVRGMQGDSQAVRPRFEWRGKTFTFAPAPDVPVRRALWLTREEAALLIALCVASPHACGAEEDLLDCLHAFWQQHHD